MTFVKYNAKNVYTCLKVQLLPGVNEVEGEALRLALEHPLFKARIDDGIIEIIEEKKVVRLEGEEKQVEKENILISLMPSIYDVKLLKKYIKKNKDPKVVEAANLQLDKIKAVEVREDKSSDLTVK